jgi:hypothetical protein
MFDGILKTVQDALTGHGNEQNADPAQNLPQNSQFGDVRPASEDPYGDPADDETAEDPSAANVDYNASTADPDLG